MMKQNPKLGPILVTIFLLFLGSHCLFLYNIVFPATYSYDEFHYIPAAKSLWELKSILNPQHPPLGKLFIGLSIALFGDNPLGWRFFSSVFGSFTLIGFYLWGLFFFQSEVLAIWVAFVTLFNQLLFVQSRTALLDVFMFGFLAWAMAGFTYLWKHREKKAGRGWTLVGSLFGLATACKWVASSFWLVSTLLLVFGIRKKLNRKVLAKLFLSFGLIPLGLYFLTFVPYFFMETGPIKLQDLLNFQLLMLNDLLQVHGTHSYSSPWWSWPWLIRPIWFYYETLGSFQELAAGVLFLGNPWVMITGMGGLIYSLKDIKLNRLNLLIPIFYFTGYLCWSLSPREFSFYYYYYPSGMILSMALGLVALKYENTKWKNLKWVFLAIEIGFFVYFYPVLVGTPYERGSFFNKLWFKNWI